VIPLTLVLHNFMPYRDPVPLDFSGIHVAGLSGDNGAGKSALLDAITWALWGRARARRDDELIHQGQTEMSVEFTFELAGNVYRAVRARKAGKRGAGMLDLQVRQPDSDFRTIAEPTMPATQAKIERLLHLNYETFINSAFLLQNRADEFTIKTPAERKQVLADILGLEQWGVYEERAKERARQAEEQIALADAELRRIDDELAQRPRYEAELSSARAAVIALGDKLRQAEEAWQKIQGAQRDAQHLDAQAAELGTRISQAERELYAVESDLADAVVRADADALRAQLAAVQTELAKLDQREEAREEALARKQLLAEEAAALRGRNEQLVPETEPIKERVATLERATQPQCPTCGQPLSEKERKRLVAQLQIEVEARRSQYRANTARLRDIAQESAQIERELAAAEADVRQRSAIQKRAAELQAAVSGAVEAQTAVQRLTQRRDQWQATLSTDHARQAELAAQLNGLRAGLGDAARAQAERDRARAEERAARDRVVRAEQQIASCDALAQQREARLAERKRLADEKGLYEELRVAFGKKGVPAMLIEAAIPEIEDEANALLARITAGRMHVRFDTQRETVKGETVETLDIKIADELGTRPYENFSGGEQFRLNFCVRVALSKLLARRAGAQLQTLVMDEGFGQLDAAGRERLVEVINAIQNDFARILVITHVEELRDAFPARIEIVKTPQGSQINVA
jgi:DNA repair protein SbcC/Rad50